MTYTCFIRSVFIQNYATQKTCTWRLITVFALIFVGLNICGHSLIQHYSKWINEKIVGWLRQWSNMWVWSECEYIYTGTMSKVHTHTCNLKRHAKSKSCCCLGQNNIFLYYSYYLYYITDILYDIAPIYATTAVIQ